MALQVWLPLRGDMHNQGLSDLEFSSLSTTNTTVNSSGKIGQCYQNNSFTAGGLVSDKVIELGQNQSMFCWFKFTTLNASSTLGGGLISQHRHASNQGMGLTIRYVSSTTGYLSVNTGNGSSRTYNTYYGTTLLQANKWYHGGYTYDGENIRIYVNGVLEKTQAFSGMLVPADYLTVFCWSMNAATGTAVHANYRLNGSINDVRVYDHCLSIKEIKEISKGLVLNYKLDDANVVSTTNLIQDYDTSFESIAVGNTTLFTNQLNSGTIKIVSDIQGHSKCLQVHSNGGSNRCYRYYGNITAGTYVVSVDYYSQSSDYLPPLRVELNGGGYSWNAITQNNLLDEDDYGVWKRYYMTFTITATTTVYLFFMCSNGKDAYFDNVQMEKGLYPTDYTKTTRTGGKVYDSSGYGNDGTVYGGIALDGNSARYSISTFIKSGTSDYVVSPTMQLPGDAITLNIWVKSSNKNAIGAYHQPFASYTGGYYEMSIHNNGYLRAGLYIGGTRYVTNSTLSNLLDGKWHMITQTYDGTTIRRYMDGVQENTTSVTGTLNGTSQSFYFGKYGTNNSYGCSDMSLSDARVYTTALSAQDVAELYHTAASIDNHGNFFCGELKEGGTNEG